VQQTLYTGEDGGDIVCGRPAVLPDVEAEFAVGVHVRMEHAREEFDSRGFVGVGLVEGQQQLEGSIFEWCVAGAKNDCIPEHNVVRQWTARDTTRRVGREPLEIANQALPAIGRHDSWIEVFFKRSLLS